MIKRVRAAWSEPYVSASVTGGPFHIEVVPLSGDAAALHARSASDLRIAADRLWIAQPQAPGRHHALFPELARRFRDAPIPKSEKPDIECLALLDLSGGPRLLALASGSTPQRRHAALLDPARARDPVVASGTLDSFYDHLSQRWDIIGTELNLEGAVAVKDALRLLQRGNGAVRAGRRGHNTAVDIPLTAWVAYMNAAFADPAATFDWESIRNIFAYDLGTVEGERLTFSGACELGGGWSVYCASAEQSPDVLRDGPTVGAALGLLAEDGRALQAHLCAADGRVLKSKVEGVAVTARRTDAIELLLAVDDDSAGEASPFLRAELRGALVKKVLAETAGGP